MRSHAAAVKLAVDRSVRRVTLTHFAMFTFGAWLVVSFLMAQYPEASESVMIEYTKIWVMFAIATIVIRTRSQVFTLVTIAAVSLAYIAYEVNYMYLFQGRYLGIFHNGYGGLDNNGAGLMLAMGVPLCVAVWDGAAKWWRWIFVAVVPVIVHAVLMTYSRGAMVSLLLASPLILLRCRRRLWMAVAATVMMFIVPLLAGAEIRQRFFSIEQYQEDGSAQSRIASWNVALAIANDYPVFGVGPRNANYFTYYYGADRWGRTIHSQSLQLMADTGYIGFACYVSVMVCTALALRRSRKRWKHDRSERGHQLYAMAYGIEASLSDVFHRHLLPVAGSVRAALLARALGGPASNTGAGTGEAADRDTSSGALGTAAPVAAAGVSDTCAMSSPTRSSSGSEPSVASTNRVRVGLVVHVMQVAGAEVLVAEIARRLAAAIEPTVFCLDSLGALGAQLRAEGISVVTLGRRPGLDPGLAWRFARELRRRRIEVIHAHQYTPFFYAACANALTAFSARLIFTEHGRHYPDIVSGRRRLLNRLVFQHLADDINAVCQFSARSLAQADGFVGRSSSRHCEWRRCGAVSGGPRPRRDPRPPGTGSRPPVHPSHRTFPPREGSPTPD